MPDPTPAEEPTDWGAIATQVLGALLTQFPDLGVHKTIVNAHADARGTVYQLIYKTALELAGKAGATMHDLEEPFFPFIAAFVAPVLSGIFGADVNTSAFAQRLARGGGNAAATSMVDNFLKAITGEQTAEIVPGDAGAKRIASAAVAAALESTFNAVATEMLSDLVPELGPHFESLTELPESIFRALGVGRLVRRALTPYVTATCATPATWAMNKKYRPTLLGASTLAKQIARNPDKRDLWLEDLRREGYSEDRIDALLNEQAKFHSVTDLDLLIRAGQWSAAEAADHLRDQGYASDIASTELQIEDLKRINAFERAMADAAIDAYVAGRIDEGAMGGFLNGSTLTSKDKARYDELAAARRICARRPLSAAEAAAAVEAEVLTIRDYRAVLRREGRDDEAIDVLDLMLRKRLDDKADLADLKQRQAAERAAEKRERDEAAAVRKAETDAKLALAKRGRLSDLEQAYIRGLLPLDRVTEVFAATYDADTVDALVALVESKRADYVAQQAAAEAARLRATTRGVDVGQLEQAVLAGVLDLGQFAGRLRDLKFSAGDADLLAATLAAKLDAKHAADAAHDQAVAAAKIKHVDLATVELLVRRGHQTIAGYRAILHALGYDDIAQAALVERLQILIDDDAAAAKARTDAAVRLASKGLSLDQFRRAVVLGITPIASYAPWLVAHGVTADAVAVLVAELQTDMDEAEAARARRTAADLRMQAGQIPLTDLRRAARLGLVDVRVYYARLQREGYSADEIAIESDLLAVELAHDRTAAARAAAADAAAPSRGLTLAQLAAAVTLGEATIDAYYARAVALGLSDADASTLVRMLQDRLAMQADAATRRDATAADDRPRELARADVATAVRDGLQTLDDYRAWLTAHGYRDDDAALLVAELQITIDAAAAKGGG